MRIWRKSGYNFYLTVIKKMEINQNNPDVVILETDENLGIIAKYLHHENGVAQSKFFLLGPQAKNDLLQMGLNEGDVISLEHLKDLLILGNAVVKDDFISESINKIEMDFNALENLKSEFAKIEENAKKNAKNKIEKANKKLTKINKEYLDLQTEIGHSMAELFELKSQIGSLRKAEVLKTKASKLKKELVLTNRKLENFSKINYTQKINTLSSRNELEREVNRKLKLEITSLKSERKELQRQLSEFCSDAASEHKFPSFFPEWPILYEWLSTLETDDFAETLDWGNSIVTSGSGPFDCNVFNQILSNHGYIPCKPGNSESFVMIVGQDCKLRDARRQINVREETGLKIYSQELALFALATHLEPFKAYTQVLLELGKSHPLISKLINDPFDWPAIQNLDHYAECSEIDVTDWNENSPLTVMGYNVGNYSTLSEEARRKLLRKIHSGKLIFPSGFSPSQKNEWGESHSKQRLKKMSHHIAWNIERFGPRSEYERAVAEWKADLNWIKKAFSKNSV